MLPANNFNQLIQQSFGQEGLDRIGIELEGSYDIRGGIKEYPRYAMVSMEYAEGVLVLSYYQEAIPRQFANPVVTEMIPWNRVRCLYWDQKNVPSRIPFPTSVSHL